MDVLFSATRAALAAAASAVPCAAFAATTVAYAATVPIKPPHATDSAAAVAVHGREQAQRPRVLPE
eukprot:scaffold87020_cov41-Phaeocystis_antarctica.AAC.2